MKPERVTNDASAPSEQPQEIAGAILPLDLIVETLSYLTPKDAWLASQTCRWWQQLLKQDPRLRAQVERNLYPDWSLAEYKAVPNTDWAARHGYLALLQWLRANDYDWHEACDAAAINDHLEVLKWAHENGCPWSERTCAYAAWQGHFEILQWLRENGCPWDGATCALAARGGHLMILQWAVTKDCPWDPDVCAVFASENTLQWINEQMQPA